MRLNSFLALFLSAVMAVPGPALAQQAGASATAAAAPKPTAVKIVVLQGEGAQNNTRSRVGVNPVVEVRDESDKPVAGAEVVFQLPAAGPGGVFNGWMRTQTARTNEKGQAGTSGFSPNDEEGRFNIKVTASMGAASASVVVAQSNTRGTTAGQSLTGGKSNWWKWAVGVGAVGVTIGAVAATRGSGTTSTTTTTPVPVTVTPGAISVGGPH